MKRLEKSNLALVIIGIIIMVGILVPSVVNTVQNHRTAHESRQLIRALKDCNQRLIVSVDKRSQFANSLRAVDRERAGIILEVAAEPDPAKRRDLFYQRNAEVDAKEKAVTAERDKFPLPSLADCKR
jgi:hypothetical protein